MSVKFLHHGGAMRGHGLKAYSQSFCNLLGTLAVCNQLQGLLFTVSRDVPFREPGLGGIGFHDGFSSCLRYAAGLVSCGILCVALISLSIAASYSPRRAARLHLAR
jgi:hypothetical protein